MKRCLPYDMGRGPQSALVDSCLSPAGHSRPPGELWTSGGGSTKPMPGFFVSPVLSPLQASAGSPLPQRRVPHTWFTPEAGATHLVQLLCQASCWRSSPPWCRSRGCTRPVATGAVVPCAPAGCLWHCRPELSRSAQGYKAILPGTPPATVQSVTPNWGTAARCIVQTTCRCPASSRARFSPRVEAPLASRPAKGPVFAPVPGGAARQR